MTLRSNSSPKARANATSFEDLSVGQKVNGTVKKIAEYGLFINVNGTKVSGLCHKSEVSRVQLRFNNTRVNYSVDHR
jgi:rRNA biogenesis protein RRP5